MALVRVFYGVALGIFVACLFDTTQRRSYNIIVTIELTKISDEKMRNIPNQSLEYFVISVMCSVCHSKLFQYSQARRFLC